MKPKTPGEVIAALKDLSMSYSILAFLTRHEIARLKRSIAIVRLWDAGITRAMVRKAERKRKGRAK